MKVAVMLVCLVGCAACRDQVNQRTEPGEPIVAVGLSTVGLSTIVDGEVGPRIPIPSTATVALFPLIDKTLGASYSVVIAHGIETRKIKDRQWASDVRVHVEGGSAIVAIYAEGNLNPVVTYSDPQIRVLAELSPSVRVMCSGQVHELEESVLDDLPTEDWSQGKKTEVVPAWQLMSAIGKVVSGEIENVRIVGRGETQNITGNELRSGTFLFRFNGTVAKVKAIAKDGTIRWRVRNVQNISIVLRHH